MEQLVAAVIGAIAVVMGHTGFLDALWGESLGKSYALSQDDLGVKK